MGKLPCRLEEILVKLPFEYYDIVFTSVNKIIENAEQLDSIYSSKDISIEDKRKVIFFHRVLLEDTKKLFLKLLGYNVASELSYLVGIEAQLLQTHEMLLTL